MKAKRRVTTSRDVRPGGIKRAPTPRRKQSSSVAAASIAPARSSPASTPGVEVVADRPVPTTEVDLSVDLGRGLVLANPILAASGPFGYGVEHADSVDIGRLGGICTRSTTLRPRTGNPPPRTVEMPGGLLNAVGLQNPGVDAIIERYAPTWAGWSTPVVVNVAGESVADVVEIVRRLEGVPGVAAIELNLSCPNNGRGGLLFAVDAAAAAALTGAVRRASDLPLLVKLSPNVTDIRPIARAIADAGADALTAINTVAGLAVATSRATPLFGTFYGGLSGPAVKPIALRVVYEISQVVDIPVVAVGGITDLVDVLDFLAVGAVAVQVGTAVLADPTLPARLVDDLTDDCRRRGLTTYADLIGTAQPRRASPPSSKGVEC